MEHGTVRASNRLVTNATHWQCARMRGQQWLVLASNAPAMSQQCACVELELATTHAMIEPLAPGGLYRLYTGVLRAPRRPVGVRTLEPDHRCGRSALERLERAPRAPHRAPRLSGRWVRWSSSARCGAPGVPPARRRHTLGWYTSPDALTRATAALRRDERRRGAQRARPKRGPTRGSWLETRRRRGRGHVARSCSEL